MHFCLKMFHRQGGHLDWTGSWSKAATESESDDSAPDMYCGVIAHRVRQTLQDELALVEKLSYEEGGSRN